MIFNDFHCLQTANWEGTVENGSRFRFQPSQLAQLLFLERGEEFHVVRFEGTDLQKRMMAGMTGMEVLFMVNRYGKIIRPNGDFAVAMITYDYWMVYRISMGFIWLNTSEYSFTHLKIAEACGLWGFPESWPQTFHDAMVIKFTQHLEWDPTWIHKGHKGSDDSFVVPIQPFQGTSTIIKDMENKLPKKFQEISSQKQRSSPAFIVDSLRLRATVLHSHSQAFSWAVLHCFGSLGGVCHQRPGSVTPEGLAHLMMVTLWKFNIAMGNVKLQKVMLSI